MTDTRKNTQLGYIDPYCEEAQKNARKNSQYSKIANSVTKCPFCDLKEKYIVAQRENAVLTVNLFPYIDGHLMVIPREHIEHLSEMPLKTWEDCHKLLTLGISLLKKALNAQDVNVLYREGSKLSGSSLKHLHIHILPILEGFMVSDEQGMGYKYQIIKKSPQEMAKILRDLYSHYYFHYSHEQVSVQDIDFMRQACLLCDKSSLEVKTGCLIVSPKGVVLGRGWNENIHAEEMAIQEVCSKSSFSDLLFGSILYTTRFPCLDCASKLVDSGVAKIFYMSDHFSSGNLALSFLESKGVEVFHIPEEDVWKNRT